MKRHTFKKSFASAMPFTFVGRRFSSMLFVVFSIAALSVSAVSPEKMSFLRASVMDGVAPALSVVGMPVQESAAFVRDVSGLASLQDENAKLRTENAKLRKWYHAAMALKSENDSLQSLMNMKPQTQGQIVSARVISDSGNRFVKSFLVGAGLNDGVKPGFTAMSGDGVIGRVVESGQTTSRILLVTDINSRVPILVENTNQHGIMAGRNSDYPVLQHFPPNAEIDDGARIVTSGHGGVFPAGLPIGRVFYENETFKVELYSDFSRITHVQMVERVDDLDASAKELN